MRSADFVKDDKKSAKATQVERYEKLGIKVNMVNESAFNDAVDYKEESNSKGSKRAWAWLIQKIY